jgi:hypothetical protein
MARVLERAPERVGRVDRVEQTRQGDSGPTVRALVAAPERQKSDLQRRGMGYRCYALEGVKMV